MAENQPAWRSGKNALKAKALIRETENLIRAKKVPAAKQSVHISVGLTGLAGSLKGKGIDPKWRQESEQILNIIETGRKIGKLRKGGKLN